MSDYALACEIVPGTLSGTRTGWYLVAANRRVEAGPFATEQDAHDAAWWLEDRGRGVNPSPWVPQFSRTGLQIGSRWRPARPTRQPGV